jgi:hypothetical protein
MRLARALDAQVHLVSYGGRGLLRDWQGKTDVLNAPQFFQLTIAEETAQLPERPAKSFQSVRAPGGDRCLGRRR